MTEKIKNARTWLISYWRPAMAWQYFAVCIFDFIIAPILWSALHGFLGQPITEWNPLTLQSGGLYHIAMGAIVGISSWSRTKEKIELIKKDSNIEPETMEH